MTTRDEADEVLRPTELDAPAADAARPSEGGLRGAGAAVRSWCVAIGRKIVAAVPVLLLLAALFGCWRLYENWRSGRVELVSEGDPLIVQVLAENSDTTIGEPFDLATRAVLTLPAGEYRLRANGKGRLGRTYRFAINRGETQTHTISIDEGRLLGGEQRPVGERRKQNPRMAMLEERLNGATERKSAKAPGPIPFATLTKALELTPGKSRLVECTEATLICRDGGTADVLWDISHPAKPFDKAHDRVPLLARHIRPFVGQSGFVVLAADLNGDGTGDLILFSQLSGSLVAVSGTDGRMLWYHFAEVEGRERTPGDDIRSLVRGLGYRFAGEPSIADVDGDGSPDVLATLLISESGLMGPQRRVLLEISGRTGRLLWTYVVDSSFTKLSPSCEGRSAVVVQGRQRALVAYVDGSEWIGLDAASGKLQSGPIDLGFDPVVPVQHADLDGDGEPEIVALGPGSAGAKRTLHAFSIKTGRELWAAPADAAYKPMLSVASLRDHPLIIDVDDDGRWEIVVPDAGAMPRLAGYRGVRLVDGLSGATRWRVPLRPSVMGDDGALAEVVLAPDLDGDGVRDVVTVSVLAGRSTPTIYVDALSGTNGRRLWWRKVDSQGMFTAIGTPRWWGLGPDGWPLLALPLGGKNFFGLTAVPLEELFADPTVHLLEASTGRERHTVMGLANMNVADLDGDGLTDLWGEVDGELRAFRGEAPEAWLALGRFDRAGSPRGDVPEIWRVLGRYDMPDPAEGSVGLAGSRMVDFDRDGVADTLVGGLRPSEKGTRGSTGSHTAVARSGRDGRVIWKTEIDRMRHWLAPNSADGYDLSAFPLPAGDLDGDGVADVVVGKRLSADDSAKPRVATLGIEVLSGRTGAGLWSAGPLPTRSGLGGSVAVEWTEVRVVDANDKPDVIAGHGVPGGLYYLARVAGRDGRIVWDVAVSDGALRYGEWLRFFDDLDGDGGLDALVLLPGSVTGTGGMNVRWWPFRCEKAGDCGRGRSRASCFRTLRFRLATLTGTNGRKLLSWEISRTRTRASRESRCSAAATARFAGSGTSPPACSLTGLSSARG